MLWWVCVLLLVGTATTAPVTLLTDEEADPILVANEGKLLARVGYRHYQTTKKNSKAVKLRDKYHC